jgi:hypothetical protein
MLGGCKHENGNSPLKRHSGNTLSGSFTVIIRHRCHQHQSIQTI